MPSKFAPPTENGESLLKFAQMSIWASQQPGKSYWDLTFNITPFDPAEGPKQRKVKTFDAGYKAVTWPSINALVTAGAIQSPDDLFTGPGETDKIFLVSYQTPKHLHQASRNDIEWATQNNRLNDFETSPQGQLMKVYWPIKLVKVYADRTEWETDAQAHAAQAPASQPAAQPAPERQAVLATLSVFVKASGFDLTKLTGMLATPPLNQYVTIDSPEVKLEVARQVAARFGHDVVAIEEFLTDKMDDYLTINSPELTSQLEEIPF